MSELRFRSISLEQMDRISPNSVYVFILTRSGLGCLFLPICNIVMALDFCQNFVSALYP